MLNYLNGFKLQIYEVCIAFANKNALSLSNSFRLRAYSAKRGCVLFVQYFEDVLSRSYCATVNTVFQ